MSKNICVSCGSPIVDEGRMICYVCEYPIEPGFGTEKVKILLRGIGDIFRFSKIVAKCKFDVVVHSGHFAVNAKSVMGLLSLNLANPLKAEFYGDLPYEIRRKIRKFIVN